ncbi:MAG: hypothetical protein CL431_03500 [Acidimicrobiaceae bacterium]|jgi:hypothetical protein|nr:hypothetical protein [Acidimicrobiaceae bacterium]|tara:strand:+ start:12777 stop:13085 length:309 start_codon:yes stop_codon:yes gene_type:complete
MFIQISVSENQATIHQSEILNTFEIRSSEPDPEEIIRIIGNKSTIIDSDHIWVSITWILNQVQHQHDSEWKEQFENMVSYAKSKGWVNESQTHLQAHIEIQP